MSKAKFEAAKELIQEKRYSEARAILATVDHPTAKEWLIKLDDLDPSVSFPAEQSRSLDFTASASGTQAAGLMRDAIILMTQHNWQPKIQQPDMAQFEKKELPNSALSAVMILALSILGFVIVCLMIAKAKYERVTFQIEGPDLLNATSSRGTFAVLDREHLRKIAEMVPSGGATYVGAILIGVISLLVWYMFLPFPK